MKTIFQDLGALFGKAVLVTLIVALGFALCGWLGLPMWAQGFGLIPAGYAFCRLSGDHVPSVRRWLPYLIGLTLLTYIFSTFFPRLPEDYRMIAFMAFVMMVPGILRRIPSPSPQPVRTPPVR